VFGLISRFVDQRTLLNYSRIKNGPGHGDFTEIEPVYVDPYAGIRYLKKVVLLVDRGTYSAGSFTALASRALPNVVLMGDTTGGGLGIPAGGQLPNGWTYRFSISQALNLDQSPEWENGVPPDIRVLVDWSDLTKDEVIERALVELR
jgi:C-terminal processing protease CtpA/Prc